MVIQCQQVIKPARHSTMKFTKRLTMSYSETGGINNVKDRQSFPLRLRHWSIPCYRFLSFNTFQSHETPKAFLLSSALLTT